MPRLGYSGNPLAPYVDASGLPAVSSHGYAFTGTLWNAVGTASGQGDANAGGNISVATSHLFNGTSYDRPRGNTQGTLLASASRSATTQSADQVNYNARGVRVYLNITVAPGVENITVGLLEKDPISGNYLAIVTSAAFVTTGQKATLEVYPGVAAVANVADSDALPRTWAVIVTHSGASAWTYSVGYALIV